MQNLSVTRNCRLGKINQENEVTKFEFIFFNLRNLVLLCEGGQYKKLELTPACTPLTSSHTRDSYFLGLDWPKLVIKFQLSGLHSLANIEAELTT